VKMKIPVIEFERYSDNAPPYINGIIFVQSGVNDADVKSTYVWLRRLCQKYEGLSFLLISSNHDSKGRLERRTLRTGKAGRPKVVLDGEPAERHIHGCIINENEETDIKKVKKEWWVRSKKHRKSRPHLKRQKTMDVWSNCLPIVSYMTRQMNETKPYKYGSFDFAYFDDIRYCKYPDDYPDEDDNYDNILEL